MSEKPPSPESVPEVDPYDAFEALVNLDQWSTEVEAQVRALLESYQEDMYLLYLNYKESGLVDDLPAAERHIFDLLECAFGNESK